MWNWYRLWKSISAFANTKGGILYFGVKDNREVVGIEDVQKGTNTPYYYSRKGAKTAYVRIGSSSVKCPDYMLNELIMSGKGSSFDAEITDKLLKDFSFTLLKATYKDRVHEDFLDEYFVSFGLANSNGFLTKAGLLFADNCPLLQSRVFCTRWFGLKKTIQSEDRDIIDDKEFNGSIINLLNNGKDFLILHNRRFWRKSPNGRIENTEYDEKSLFEALTNALIHRVYSIIGSEVHIDIFDNRIEIYSPGGMYDGTKIQDLDLLHIESKRRNPVIADLFSRLRFMERKNSGIKDIYERLGKDNNVEFYSDHDDFSVTFYNMYYEQKENDTNNDTNDTKEKIYKLIKDNAKIKQKEIVDILGISLATVKRNVKELQDDKKIRRKGSSRNGYWEIL